MRRHPILLIPVILAAMLAFVPAERSPAIHGFGWVPDRAAAEAIAASLPCPHFADSDAFRRDSAGPDDCFLWEFCRTVTGDLLPPRDQGNVGACVGFGTAAAVEHLMCVQAATGSGETFREVSPEIIYAGSRVEIGGGRIRGDGSVGAWAARFVKEYGILPRDRYPKLDLTVYDPKRCRRLGVTGVPDDLEPLAKRHPVRAITSVRSFAECRAAIRNGYPMIVCSGQGFAMTRDADGFCEPRGVWMHCFAIVGVRGGERPGAFLLNSWGANAHPGPRGAGNPSPAGFWADADVVDRMLAEGDSWAFSQFTGFPARRLNWNCRNEEASENPTAEPWLRGERALIAAANPRQSHCPPRRRIRGLSTMFHRMFRKIRRQARSWTTDPTRADRNAVIQRVVAAAAKESKDQIPLGGGVRPSPTPMPRPSPFDEPSPAPSVLAAQLLGRDSPTEPAPMAEITGDRIGQRAFEIWVRNGRPLGTASRDWAQAEAELRAERTSP